MLRNPDGLHGLFEALRVVRLAGTQDGSKWDALAVADEMELGPQTPTRAAQRMVPRLTGAVPGASGRPRGSNRAPIQAPQVTIDLASCVEFTLEGLDDGVEGPVLGPPIKAALHRVPRPVACGQVTPGRARTEYPENPVEYLAMVVPRPATRSGCWEQPLNALPRFVAQFMSLHPIA